MCGLGGGYHQSYQRSRTVEVDALYLEQLERKLAELRHELLVCRLAEHGQTSLEG